VKQVYVSALAMSVVLAACEGSEAELIAAKTTGKNAAKAESIIALNPDKNAYFGDLHIHTKNSFDADIFVARSGPNFSTAITLLI